MDASETVYSVGAGIFGGCGLITLGIFINYVSKGYKALYPAAICVDNKKVTPPSLVGRAHWKKSIWIYMALTVSFFLLTFLYAMNASDSGFMVKSNFHTVNWLRWIIMAVIAIVYTACLAFIMTEEDDTVSSVTHRAPIRAQSMAILFFYAFSMILLFFGTITTSIRAHWLCMVFSFLAFVASVLLYFFPHNKFALPTNVIDSWTYAYFIDQYGNKREDCAEKRVPVETVTLAYRGVFLGFMILAYVLTIFVWFFSRSNDIVEPAQGLNLLGEAIAYLVVDCIAFIPFTITLLVLTFKYHQQTLLVVDKDVLVPTTYYPPRQQEQLQAPVNVVTGPFNYGTPVVTTSLRVH